MDQLSECEVQRYSTPIFGFLYSFFLLLKFQRPSTWLALVLNALRDWFYFTTDSCKIPNDSWVLLFFFFFFCDARDQLWWTFIVTMKLFIILYIIQTSHNVCLIHKHGVWTFFKKLGLLVFTLFGIDLVSIHDNCHRRSRHCN